MNLPSVSPVTSPTMVLTPTMRKIKNYFSETKIFSVLENRLKRAGAPCRFYMHGGSAFSLYKENSGDNIPLPKTDDFDCICEIKTNASFHVVDQAIQTLLLAPLMKLLGPRFSIRFVLNKSLDFGIWQISEGSVAVLELNIMVKPILIRKSVITNIKHIPVLRLDVLTKEQIELLVLDHYRDILVKSTKTVMAKKVAKSLVRIKYYLLTLGNKQPPIHIPKNIIDILIGYRVTQNRISKARHQTVISTAVHSNKYSPNRVSRRLPPRIRARSPPKTKYESLKHSLKSLRKFKSYKKTPTVTRMNINTVNRMNIN